MIVAKVIELAITATMKNHCYRFAGHVYTQTSGCPIGLALSGIVVQIRTNRWIRRMRDLLEENLCKTYLLEKYVDDINVLMEALGLGVRWFDGSLRWSQTWEEEDEKSGVTRDELTMRQFTYMANSICKDIKFTYDLPEKHPDGRCPMLDVAVWVEEKEDKTKVYGQQEIVRNAFYEKTCASGLVMMQSSALPENMKMNSTARR